MKKFRYIAILFAVIVFSLSDISYAEDALGIVEKSHLAFFYPGNDMKVRVYMKLIGKDGGERIREMTMLRKDYEEGGDQKYFIYFYQPADVRDMTFMVYKYSGRDDSRWLFMPALNMVRRIAASDKKTSFAGSDFTYEDVSGRDIDEDTHVIVKEEKIGNRDTYVIKSAPGEEKGAELGYKLSWIDKNNLLPLKEEYYDRKGELSKVFTSDEVKDVQGFPVAVKRTMRDVKSERKSEVEFLKIEFNVGLDDSVFTERHLKKPLKKWIE